MPLGDKTAYLVMDTESIPDGRLLGLCKIPRRKSGAGRRRAPRPGRAARAIVEQFGLLAGRVPGPGGGVHHSPDAGFRLQRITCLDAPQFRPREIVRAFWEGMARITAKLVTYNGRAFDLPLLEVARLSLWPVRARLLPQQPEPFQWAHRHPRLAEYFGAVRHSGRAETCSRSCWASRARWRRPAIRSTRSSRRENFSRSTDYCTYDTLDTYFVFLRRLVLTGDITLEQEHELVEHARAFLVARNGEDPGPAALSR